METLLRQYLPIIACALLFGPLNGQTEKIRQLQEQLLPLSGVPRAVKLIELSDACIEAGDYDQAEKWADEAESLADSKKVNAPEMRAIAYNRWGKALLRNDWRKKNANKASGKFDKSLDILYKINSQNKPLMLENLGYLRQIAQNANDSKDLAKVEAQIAKVNGTVVVSALPAPATPATAPPPPNIPLTKRELQQELNNAITKITANAKMSAEAQNKLLEQSKILQDKLAQREAALDTMSEREMKYNMVLMQQRFMLDSLGYRANLDSLAIANSTLALREANTNRNFYLAGMVALLLLAGGSLFSFARARQHAKALSEKNAIIREEQQRSEDLLLNILPVLVAEELKKQGHTKARYFDDVGVLFADFVGFSKIAEKLTPQQLVSDLDTCFQQFDSIIAQYGLEKIKTIGDAYMCAGGLPNGGGSQLRSMVDAALDMQSWLLQWNREREKQGLPRYDARIGIHSGAVVAGVVGSKKFAFDIWGDTVNIAARVEQAGEGGKVNVSGSVYEAVKNQFEFKHRGKIPIKNKGEIEMYFLES